MELNFSELNLYCPISDVRMIEPVTLPQCDIYYDRRSVVKKMNGEHLLLTSGKNLKNVKGSKNGFANIAR